MKMIYIASMSDKALDTDDVYFEISDGILFITYKAGINITLEKAKLMVTNRLDFTSYQSYPILVDDKGLTSIDKRLGITWHQKKGLNW